MSITIERAADATNEIVCTSDSAVSPPFGFGNMAGGMIFCTAAVAADGVTPLASITVAFYAHFDPSQTASQLADAANNAVTIVMAPGRCYELPSALFAAAQVRVVPTTTGQTCKIRFIGKA